MNEADGVVATMAAPAPAETDARAEASPTVWRPPGWRRSLQLMLATVWLLDGVLQLQPFMFTRGSNGFSGMLAGTAAGNPHWVGSSITWNANIVDHHAAATNAVFALIQLLLGLGIAWRPTVKPTLAASVAWSLGVWWFGEGLGGILHGNGTPLSGGPGAVLFYALLAVLLWPPASDDAYPFAAAGGIGAGPAKAVWAVTWCAMALLSLFGSGRSPDGVHDTITGLAQSQPGWIQIIDSHAASAVAHDGLVVAVVFAVLCVAIGLGIYLGPTMTKVVVMVAIVVALVIWVVTENFGMILPGGATDPNSGPLLVLLALSYWPVRQSVVSVSAAGSVAAAAEVA